MTSSVPVDLRQPTLSFVLLAASYVVAVVMVVTVLGFDAGGFFPVVFVVAVVGITAANTARALSRVRTTPEGTLVVRNWFRTTTLRPGDVDRVMTGRQGGPGSLRRVELLRTDGSTLHLVATENLPLPGSRDRLEQQAEQLRGWAGGR